LARAENLAIRVGGPDLPSQGKDSIVVPLFLSNFSATGIERLAFTILYNAESLQLKAVHSLVDPDFSLAFDHDSEQGSGRLTFISEAGGQPYGSTKWVELIFYPKGDFTPSQIRITQGEVNGEPGQTFADAAFQLTLGTASRADVDGDGAIDFKDVDAAFQYLLSTRFPSRQANRYEFSGKAPVGAFDVSRLERHLLGYIPTLPLITSDSTSPTRNNSGLTLGPPVHLTGDYYRYQITGTGVKGLLAGEFSLTIDTEVFGSFATGESPFANHVGGTVNTVSTSQNSPNQLQLYVAGADSLAGDGELVRFTIKHQSGKSASAFTGLYSAYLNEGAFQGPGFISQPNDKDGGSTTRLTRASKPKATDRLLFLPRYDLTLSIPFHADRIEVLDAQGRIRWKQDLSRQAISLEFPQMGQCAYIRVFSGGFFQVWALPFIP